MTMSTPQQRVADLIARAARETPGGLPYQGTMPPVAPPPVAPPPVAQPPVAPPPAQPVARKVSLLEVAQASLELSQLNAQLLEKMAPTLDAIGQAVLEIHQALYQQVPQGRSSQSEDDF